MLVLFSLVVTIGAGEMAVLDPALYLSPSPPMRTGKDNLPADVWMQTRTAVHDVPTNLPTSTVTESFITTTTQPEVLENADTFWPGLRSIKREIHIPLTFHLTGAYGGYRSGVIGSRYAGITGIMGIRDNLGKAGLAGSSYASQWGGAGVKVYGGNTSPGWSGWGNGKWGHYGKG